MQFNQRLRNVVANHRARQRFDACHRHCRICDDAACTHDGDHVRTLHHFFKLVADEKDRAPFRLQLTHKLEEFVDLRRR